MKVNFYENSTNNGLENQLDQAAGMISVLPAATHAISAPTSFKVFIMTNTCRFLQFLGQIDEENHELILTPSSSCITEADTRCVQTIRHDLMGLSVTSIDSKAQRFTCAAKRHFVITLTFQEGIRKLFFLSHDQMLSALDVLIRVGQKFARRADQYQVIDQKLSGEVVLKHKVVIHRLTRQKHILKTIPHDAPQCIAEQARSEILALQTSSGLKQTVQLVDQFTDEQGNTVFVQNLHNDAQRVPGGEPRG